MKLWRSGILLSAAGFIGGFGNFAFQYIISHRLTDKEYGTANTMMGYISSLGLLPLIVSTALAYYVANLKGHDQPGRLQGLISSYRSFLLRATIVGSLVALALAQPLAHFFHYEQGLVLVGIICVLVGLWSQFAISLCQGLGWFNRLAAVGLLAVAMRLAFTLVMTKQFATAEIAVSATSFSLLANVVLLCWWKDIFTHTSEEASPWNKEFLTVLIAAAGWVIGNWCFFSGDLSVANKYFTSAELSSYTAAGVLGKAVVSTVGPFLTVLFTSRSGRKTAQASSDQRKILGLYASGPITAALGAVVLGNLCLKILGKYSDQASHLIARFAFTMATVGLLQAIATWSLASRWLKISVLYGIVGLVYWCGLLYYGRHPDNLINTMLAGCLTAFVIIYGFWWIEYRKYRQLESTAAPAT